MLLALAWIIWAAQPDRTPAIYRCPAAEAESKRLASLIDDESFSLLCIEPGPGPNARKAALGKLTFVPARAIDTAVNRRWRDATVALAAGKISPREWLAKIRGLHETVHYLSSPSTRDLRSELPGDSGPAVFAEVLLLSWPGKPCLTSGDIWRTRDLPDAGPLQSWVLAMNDLMGPMLQYRHDNPSIVTTAPMVVRADAKPGLLAFRQKSGGRVVTFYFNNSHGPVELPPVNLDKITINRGLNIDGPKPLLQRSGFLFEELTN